MTPPLVLMYHSVIPYDHDPYLVTVSPLRLDRQFTWLRRQGLRGVSMRELLAARDRGAAQGLVGLTFDDGYADFADYVLPALRRHRFTATVFVIAGRLGGGNDWDPEGPRKPLMTADQVRQVAAEGVEIGSHGMWHRSLPGLSSDTLVAETASSRAVLRDLSGQNVTGFCYPYGDLSAPTVERVRAAGYDYGCAIWRSALTGRLALPRTYVGDDDTGPRLWAKRLRHWIVSRSSANPATANPTSHVPAGSVPAQRPVQNVPTTSVTGNPMPRETEESHP
ncbi:MAG TPA: polysaccharide deacetylase family protein [Pseudonocardiaceae bacterium]